MRPEGGTNSAPPCAVTRATKSVMDFLTAPSFQDGSGSDWASTHRCGKATQQSPSKATNSARRTAEAIEIPTIILTRIVTMVSDRKPCRPAAKQAGVYVQTF